jgi:hypothetical protein
VRESLLLAERSSVGLVGGVVSAWKEFSFGNLFMGLVQPIIHPIDTLDGYFDQLLDFLKSPSLDRIVGLARDVEGFIAIWAGALALLFGGFTLLLGAAVVLIPGAAPVGVIAASLTADAAFFWILFLVLEGDRLCPFVGDAEMLLEQRDALGDVVGRHRGRAVERQAEDEGVGGDLEPAWFGSLVHVGAVT